MNKNTGILVSAVAAVVGLALFSILTYVGINNSVSKAENNVDASWSQVEAQYQSRADLVKQTVPVVKAAAKSEGELLEKALKARYTGTTPADVNKSEGELNKALSRLLSIQENYPQLRSQDRFQDLTAQIEGSENRIRVARGKYNEAVLAFNNKVSTFPGSITGKDKKKGFSSQEGSDQAPEIDLGE